jgi:NAD kinase
MENLHGDFKTNKFRVPLILFRKDDEMGEEYVIKVISFLKQTSQVKEIYLESEEFIQKIEEKWNVFSDLTINKNENCPIKVKENQNLQNIDICIIIGGDGTVLTANLIFGSMQRPPFISFYTDIQGYMSIYNCTDYKNILMSLYKHEKLSIEKRSVLNVTIVDKNSNEMDEYYLLNDIIIERTNDFHMINLNLYLNEKPLTNVRCDGLIFASSTGSTAYSMTAGGTILHFDIEAVILNALCAHSLSFRPMALPKGATLKATLGEDHNLKVQIVMDGRIYILLKQSQYVNISVSQNIYVEFIILEGIITDRMELWRLKVVDQLGWNNAFKNIKN